MTPASSPPQDEGHPSDACPLALIALVIWAALGLGLILPAPAPAASCGGAVVCRCGDTVTANYALTHDLGPCPRHGLIVASNVRLDCQGYRVSGLADGSEQFGIFLNGKPGAEVRGATVKDCHVSGFLRGIRLRAASSNVIVGNSSIANGNHRTHEGYGIDVSGASPNNLFENIKVQRNADEGIHIGYGSHKNRVVGNVSTENHRENLYVLGADGGFFSKNTLGIEGSNSLYVKDASSNRFEDNTFLGKTVRIIGNAHDNQFVNNTFSGAGLHFTFYKGARPFRSPTANRVSGGSITRATNCLRFTSSRGNVVDGTALPACHTTVRNESPVGPSDNTLIGATPSSVELDEGSTLNLGWQLVVQVRDAGGAPVAGANVEVKNAAGTSVVTATTDAAGDVPAQPVVTSVRTAARTATLMPLTLTGAKPGHAAVTRTVPLADTLTLTIPLAAE